MKRRQFIQAALASSGVAFAPSIFSENIISNQDTPKVTTKIIPSTGEMLPVIGLGSFVNFNFPEDAATFSQRTQLLDKFFNMGGKLIDSSPMYSSSEKNLGISIKPELSKTELFSATKVWTSSVDGGVDEIEKSRNLWKVDRFDLLQVHNLLSWEGHLKTLFKMKEKGQLRYVGVTTSHGRRHNDLEDIMLTQPIDFVQATYNIRDREVEQRILPIAKERGIAFIANRPFQRGSLIDWVNKYPLPNIAKDLECDNWASLLLKYTVSHPSVNCAIPATTRIDHLIENMSALSGPMPDEKMRVNIQNTIRNL